MFNLNTVLHAAVSAGAVFFSKLVQSPEFKAFEAAATPVADVALTGALATAVGPAAPLVASLVVNEGENLVNAGLNAAAAQAPAATSPLESAMATDAAQTVLNLGTAEIAKIG